MNTYHIDLATGETTQHSAGIPGAYTPDDQFIDPAALEQPEVRRALADIYRQLRASRRRVAPAPTQESLP